MRIGIDARFYGPIGKGLGRYTERLIQNLELEANGHEFVVFLRRENFDLYRPANPRFRKVLADFGWYGLAEQIKLPRLIRRERIDLMHFPHFNVPILVPCPFVVTIHDLILFRYPTRRGSTLPGFLYAAKYAAYRLVIARAVRGARRIIAVSECTKRDIVERFLIPAERVTVTYEAADGAAPTGDAAADIDSKITKPYFLYVGNAYPHKNLEALLAAFKGLRDGGLEAQLVLVGKSDYFYERIREEAKRLGLDRGEVVFYGFAEEGELAELYRRARAYVFPSLLEGFGLPPLEAMRFGTPVAAAGNSCLPEILGEAAVYFEPTDVADMQQAMREVFADEGLRRLLAEKGPRRVASFSWRRCAKETLGIYERALTVPKL